MIIAGEFSFNHGKEYIVEHYPELLNEVYEIIPNIQAELHKTKESKEKTMTGKQLYSPKGLNQSFKEQFYTRKWVSKRVVCKYSTEFYLPEYQIPVKLSKRNTYREMDFIKNNLGVEVQFGKYAFMVYDVFAKMVIFHKLGYINAGIEIVPVKRFANEMSTGVAFFEQFVWDLMQRGVSNIDIPVLILGIDHAEN